MRCFGATPGTSLAGGLHPVLDLLERFTVGAGQLAGLGQDQPAHDRIPRCQRHQLDEGAGKHFINSAPPAGGRKVFVNHGIHISFHL